MNGGGMPRSVGDMKNLTMEASCQPEKHNAYCQNAQYMLPSFLSVRVDSSAKMDFLERDCFRPMVNHVAFFLNG